MVRKRYKKPNIEDLFVETCSLVNLERNIQNFCSEFVNSERISDFGDLAFVTKLFKYYSKRDVQISIIDKFCRIWTHKFQFGKKG